MLSWASASAAYQKQAINVDRFYCTRSHCLGWHRAQERIYLSKRKGFVKVALQAGADIVPVYILGQSQVITL